MSKNNWVHKRAQVIITYYGESFFQGKRVLDVGSGHGDFAVLMANLGAEVTCVDVRKQHLDLIRNQNPKIKCVKADLDQEWPFTGAVFDIILHLGTLNHLMHIDKHMVNVCGSTNHLVLDTQLCDSQSPNKIIFIKERAEPFKAANGIGTRPSSAFIEKTLTNLGMEFERVKSDALNSTPYIYNWIERGTDTYKDGLSGFWFAKRHNVIATIGHPPPRTASRIRPINTVISSHLHNTTPSVDAALGNAAAFSINDYVKQSEDPVRNRSKAFALINKENILSPTTFGTAGVILPLSVQSRAWFNKISPLFPNVRLHSLAHTMRGFDKTNDNANVVMCSVNDLQKHRRLWIEEWSNHELNEQDVATLKSCSLILTPSLLNAQQIQKSLPDANIRKIHRHWPMFNVPSEDKNYYLYFEKHPQVTRALFDAWEEAWGRLFVVNSSIPLPDFAEYVSDCDGFQTISKYIMGAKAIIDISDNNYYMSGLQDLVKSYGLPIITNNQYGVDRGCHVLVSQDKAVGLLPTAAHIKKAIYQCIVKNEFTTASFNGAHNANVNESLRKILGV